MATAMKRLGVYLGLVDDEVDYPVSGSPAQAAQQSQPSYRSASQASQRRAEAPSRPTSQAAHVEGGASVATLQRRTSPSVETTATAAQDVYQTIHTIHPRSYNDARRIGEEFRGGAPVIMNLSEMDDVDAKRIVDFAAGLVFAIHGSMERVTKKVFLLSPANVDVRDAPAVQQARDGFFNQS